MSALAGPDVATGLATVLGAVLAASLVGSLHCAGMCGPFLAFVVGAGPRGTGALRLQAAYHAARGAGYMTLGAAAGAAGALLDLAGGLAGLQPVAAAVAGATLVLLGVATLARLAGLRLRFGALALPEGLARRVRAAQTRALGLSPLARALAIGATTTLLPCGWLYAFAVTAAGTGAALAGAAVMLVFWLGTLPILVSLGAALRGATRRFGPRLEAAASVLLVALGLFALSGRGALSPAALAATASAREAAGAAIPDPHSVPACCACGGAESTTDCP